MLDFAENDPRLTTPVSRRRVLQNSAAGFGSLALASLLGNQAGNQVSAESGSGKPLALDPLAPKAPHHLARAKRVIFLFMSGGPSQVDTFDYKPLLTRDDGKPFPFAKPRVQFNGTGNLLKSPWNFKQYGQCGHWVSDLFPKMAERADDLCLIHSIHGTNPAHGGAVMKVHTGSDNFVRPSIGSWVSYGLGTENANLPAFVTICPTLAFGGVNNWNSAFLPAVYQGTALGNASVPSDKARVKFIRNERLSPEIQRLQLDRLQQVNREHQLRAGADASLEARINSFELAFRMQSEVPRVEDLSGESEATHKLYGLDNPITANFGRMCLMARRFAESGVRFIQVTHNDDKVQWDQHAELKRDHEKNAREVDLPIAGLLKDLKARGLLQDTLVWWGGEFGRTPTAEGTGRDHNPEGFTMWLAGGGVKGGLRYGTTDDYGYFAAENKVHIHDLHATMLHLLGLNHERLTYRYSGRDFRL
ncbi:MAG: Sulfatase, partial [Planctomycetaceae bacterium]|nr:Sulfatase [Planctomycetaceae bacterium]